jgi:hypothetical protein
VIFGTSYLNGNLISDIQTLETWQGKKNAMIQYYTGWAGAPSANGCSGTANEANSLFSTFLPAIWSNGNVPMITWEPACISLEDIASGAADTYINDWFDRWKKWLSGPDGVYGTSDDRRGFLRFAHEMNGNWYRWGQQSPATYISATRHINDLKLAKGITNTRLANVWCPNAGDVGAYTLESYYPGDAYVDWLCTDTYPYYKEAAPNDVPSFLLATPLSRLKAINSTKPIMIGEIGVPTVASVPGVTVAAKSAWILSSFEYVNAHPQVKAILWWNRNLPPAGSVTKDFGAFTPTSDSNGNGDALYGAFSVYLGYQTAVQQSWVHGAEPDNPRHLSDAEFLGQLP